MEQLNLFELTKERYVISKPIRLIELFGGIGSQAKALEKLGVNFEHYKLVEFDKFAVKSYNAIHNTNFEIVDISKITASQLKIVDTNNFEYIVTYSFPCQDLSLAGKRKGMSKNSNTRSGLLWEVERLLNECKELPQILVMENVPAVCDKNNVADFREWILTLEELGYSNYFKLLNAKDFGIPQNRNRAFLISILGDYYYSFPTPFPLQLKLKDLLENEVDEKYFLSEAMLKCFTDLTNHNGFIRGKQFKPHNVDTAQYAYTITTNTGNRATDNFIKVPNGTNQGYTLAFDGDYINLSYLNSKNRRGRVGKEISQTLLCGDFNGVYVDYKIRKLTPLECWRLMGFSDIDFYKAQKVNSNTQLYKQAGNSIVVDVLYYIFKELF